MHRITIAISLLIGCTSDPLALEGSSSSRDLDVQAHAQYTRCEGKPCTLIEVEMFRTNDTGSTYAADTSARLSIDGEPSIDMPFEPIATVPNGGTFRVTADHWIHLLRIDAKAGTDNASLAREATIATPDEANVQLEDTIVLGAMTALRWNGQDRARASVLYATYVPSLRFGFLTNETEDNGKLELGPSLFTVAGVYTISLYRSITHYAENDDDRLVLTWGSNWQKRVTVSNTPQI